MKLCDFGFARAMSINTLVLTSIKVILFDDQGHAFIQLYSSSTACLVFRDLQQFVLFFFAGDSFVHVSRIGGGEAIRSHC